MADNNDSGVNNADSMGAAVPEARSYYIVARDQSGNIASEGSVPAERLNRARRLFMDEGWTVEVKPETDTPTE